MSMPAFLWERNTSARGEGHLGTLLFATPPWDAPTLSAVAAVLAGATMLTSYTPARRSAAISPIESLRVE